MDWLTFAALLSAVGTLIIAAITLINVRALRTQVKITERQVLLQRSTVYPLLETDSLEIKENTFHTKLTNKGNGPAFRIGVRTRFIPLKPTGNGFDFVKQLRVHDQKKEAYPSEVVVFLKTTNGKSRLYPQQLEEFKAELLFWHNPFKTASAYPWMDLLRGKSVYAGKGCSFDELK